MTAATFLFHQFNSLNWKLWAVSCLSATVMIGYNLICSPNVLAETRMLNQIGSTAEKQGYYKEAKMDFALAIERARAAKDKEALATALLNASRIDSYFEEDHSAISLAGEALGICKQLYGDADVHSALAAIAVADVCPSDFAIPLYKGALPVLREQNDKRIDYAHALRELAYCYAETEQHANAVSACKASLRIFEQNKEAHPGEYAQSLVQFAGLVELEDAQREAALRKALQIQEAKLGKSHPELAPTLTELSFSVPSNKEKIELQKRALQIDSTTFGDSSNQVSRDLANLSTSLESAGEKQLASDARNRLASTFKAKDDMLENLSQDFLQGYSKILHDLHFENDAKRIDKIIKRKFGTLEDAGRGNTTAEDAIADATDYESDPELYWQCVTLPINKVSEFFTPEYDHVQVTMQKGELTLEAFKEGESIFQTKLGSVPSGQVNLTARKDAIEVSSRLNDGPIWKRDIFKIAKNKAKLESSNEEDAYCTMLTEQLEDVLQLKAESTAFGGAVEAVPVQYLNNNFIADAIHKAESKALQHYGQGDAYNAARTLSAVFDLSFYAINTQREEYKADKMEPELWMDAWKWRKLPTDKYITALNDYGFYLLQSGRYSEAVRVLEAVTKEQPERAVAFLNLGDALWCSEEQALSAEAYQHYLTLNKARKESHDSIPARVIQRIAKAQHGGMPNS
ncbi:MAG: hypothetical protein K2X77_28955 [Candidatus Obscuribacterales bacterium]|nr:hypothetical protein [Candidatus Obscuribacterales bacterium]